MKKILIIDDDVEYSKTLSDILETESFKVDTIDYTEGAVEYIKENKPDLLILDIIFPENPAAGFDLAREIRKVSEIKDLPIIFLTSINQEFPMDFSAKDMDEDWIPAQDFIDKPAEPELLIKKINKLLESTG